MSENTADKKDFNPQAREFTLGSDEKINAIQKGRVTRLAHPVYGTTYLIDVTNRVDPTMYDENDKTTPRETLDQVFFGRGENPEQKDHYADNNGVIVLITNRLDPENRSRIYCGVAISDPADEEGKEITQYVLDSAGFKQGSYYVPFSFDSDLVKEYMAQEIVDAVKESPQGILNPFSDFQSLLSPNSNSDE